MPALPFKQVDVFTRTPFLGNPVAVVFNASALSETAMQQIARWTNLSETTFVLPSTTAHYRLRIFSPAGELPFAGHPTIGSAHAAREANLVPREVTTFTQECAAGVIPLAVDERGIHARVPTPKLLERPVDAARLRAALGAKVHDPRIINLGPVWIVAKIEGDIYSLTVDDDAIAALSRELGATGVTVYEIAQNDGVRVRSFAPAAGIPEDPVCGSGNAAVAAHLTTYGLQKRVGSRYTARQGHAVGRDGRVEVKIDGGEVMIGGMCVTVVDGIINV
ncbi:MAG: PhzF family phenazine biosynthesis protein [Candidatus Rokubacteria bacterium]|nr:PhzF family phenazine biosynthesis protein [Candidatus Rokubacteria bacterium]